MEEEVYGEKARLAELELGGENAYRLKVECHGGFDTHATQRALSTGMACPPFAQRAKTKI